MTTFHLSRVRLNTQASARALAPLILPADESTRIGAAHHFLWSLFADGPERQRDFLWREERPRAARQRNAFMVLSARPPRDAHGLFEVETKPFEPSLAEGDRLRFCLRANPAASRTQEGARRGRRVDPVALALKDLPPEERRNRRHEITTEVGRRWLEKQGARAGFSVSENLVVDGDEWRAIPRGDGKFISFSVLDFEGELTVRDPALFLVKHAGGFGKAKAFGCGLMLIRRA